jgi:hypothetical protein
MIDQSNSDGLSVGWPGFDSHQGKICLFFTASRPVLSGREAGPPSSAEVESGGAVPPLPDVFMAYCLSNTLLLYQQKTGT